MLWSCSKKVHTIWEECSAEFKSGGTIKIKLFEYDNFVSVTRLDDFIKHFHDVDFTAFHTANKFIISFLFAKSSFCWFYLLLVSLFMLKAVLIYNLS